MTSIVQILKNVFAPKKCYSCKKEGHFLCQKCASEIGFFHPICPICKQLSENFKIHFYCNTTGIYYDQVFILFHYKNFIIKKLITDAKFYGMKDILEDFSDYVGRFLEMHNISREEIICIPTPMHFFKKIQRGYNQSEVLTQFVSQKYGYMHTMKLIRKVKYTSAQSHLSKQQRMINLEGSFRINKKELLKIQGKKILIIDDVFSTGSTTNEIAKLLKKNGVPYVYVLSLASD